MYIGCRARACYSGHMARKKRTGWFSPDKKGKGLFEGNGSWGDRWLRGRGKKKRRKANLLSSPIDFKRKKKGDAFDRAAKRLERVQSGDDKRAGLISRLLMAVGRERSVFQPPMTVVETDANGMPQSAPVVEERPSVQQRIEGFFKGIFRRR